MSLSAKLNLGPLREIVCTETVLQAYMLNPAIYSAHLKLHPLMVLVTLVIAEHSLGVWGLLLAVPLTVFALDYLIRYPESSVTEVGAKELEKVTHTRDEGDYSPIASRDGAVLPKPGRGDSPDSQPLML